jgi:superfamily I DNA/RNA helicase
LNYIEVAANLDTPLTPRVARQLVEIVNRPNRFTKKDSFAAFVEDALRGRATIQAVLADGYGLREAGVIDKAAGLLNDLALTLRRSTSEGQRNAGDVLDSLLTQIDFKAAFSSFQNDSRADDEVMKMQMLCMLLDSANIAPRAARSYLESMDTTRGRPREECIQITSIFRAKGLEWDYAILPGLLDGHCPDTRETVNVCVNVSDPNRTLSPTETLESERRLFYVAVTRARKGLYLFADASDSRPESRFIPEAVVEPTLHAVGLLQRLGRRADNPNLCVKGLVESAGKDARLREGVLKMLRRMATDASAEEVKKVVGNATYLVNSRESAPFTYPRAYPEMSRGGASVSQQGGPLGLPF